MSAEQWDLFWPSLIGSLVVAGVSIVTICIANAHQTKLKRVEQSRSDLDTLSRSVSGVTSFCDEAKEYIAAFQKFEAAPEHEKTDAIDEMQMTLGWMKKSGEQAEEGLTRMQFISPYSLIREKCGELYDNLDAVGVSLGKILEGVGSDSVAKESLQLIEVLSQNAAKLKTEILKKYW